MGIRMNPKDGRIWLTEEKYLGVVKPLKDVTKDVLLAMASDIVIEDGNKSVSRDIRFSDGAILRVTVEDVTKEESE